MKIPVRKTKDGTTVPPEAPATAGPTPAAYPELKMADALALAESIHRMAARAGEPDRNALLGMVTGIESRVAGFEAELTKSGQSFVDLSRHLDEQAARLAGIEEEFASRLGRVAATVGARLDESLARARETRDSIETANAGTAARIDGLESREEEVARRFDKLADDIGRLAGRLDDIDLERRPIEEEVGRLARAVDSLGRLNETLAATAAAGQAALRSRIETSDTGLSGLGGIVEALAARVEALESRKAHPVRAWVFSRLPRVNSWLSGLRA